MTNELKHAGVGKLSTPPPPGRGSGRYELGSGDNPFQHQNTTFLSAVSDLRKQGLTDKEVAVFLLGEGSNTTDLRREISIATKESRKASRATALALMEECNGNVSEVARRMGKNESSIRSLLDPVLAERTDKYQNTAEMLKKRIEESQSGIIDVSKGVEHYLGVTDTTKKVALSMLEKEGYVKTWVKIPTGKDQSTTVMVIAKKLEGETDKEAFARIQQNKYNIDAIQEFSSDGGKQWWTPEFPTSVDSDRVMIRYKEDGGSEKDGVIEIRKGVEDLSLGDSRYAQVRIAVDDSKYMKGMAIYATEDMPDGIDIIYNTNKHSDTPKSEVFKDMKTVKLADGTEVIDQDNPFGALIRNPKDRDGVITPAGQSYYEDSKTGESKLSPINKLQDEGDWDSWSKTLSAQFLSKQPIKVINQQIDLSLAEKSRELAEINSLTNLVIKKSLLNDFAEQCDSTAADLSVTGFKNQAYQVLIPVTDMKDNEIYAPNYKNGDTVALVRYPHGGTFEIPVLTVNNKQKTAKEVLGNAKDAVGINSAVAQQLSGADYDGDTALVIPLDSNNLSLSHKKYYKELVNFDPKEQYAMPKGQSNGMSDSTKQMEMGKVTNLITDMTAQRALDSEIIKAVKHSMVVIDAKKHNLDYKQSAIDNDIDSLKKKYQLKINENGNESTGASTIFSRAGAEVWVDRRKEVTDTSRMTSEEKADWDAGKKVYRKTEEKVLEIVTNISDMTSEELDRHNAGKKVYRKTDKNKKEKVSAMSLVDDATELVRNKQDLKEMAYANYANELKEMANSARQEARSITSYKISTEARKTYADEVASLDAKLKKAQTNAPKERKAQMIANSITSIKFKENDMDYEHRQREKQRAITEARAIVGAKKDLIEITDSEWDAIQSGAVSFSKLEQIISNTDQDAFKKRAMPKKSTTSLSNADISLIKSMNNSGMYTTKEIADKLGVSTSTVSNYIN